MLESSQNGGDGEREIRNMGKGMMNVTSKDALLSKHMIDKARNYEKKKTIWFTCKPVVHQNRSGQSVKKIIQIYFHITNHCSINYDYQKGKK
jgi:peptidyl-tRNA hydrolase